MAVISTPTILLGVSFVPMQVFGRFLPLLTVLLLYINMTPEEVFGRLS